MNEVTGITTIIGNTESLVYDFVRAYLLLLWAMLWPLAFGFLLSAFVRTRVPDSVIMRHMGHNTLLGGVTSFIFGAVSSVCNYAVVGMARTLRMKGATWSNTFTYMTASTDLGITMIIAIYGLLGASFLGLEIAAALIFTVSGYVFVMLLALPKPELSHAMRDEMPQSTVAKAEEAPSLLDTWTQTAVHFYDDIAMTRRDILVGMAIASALGVVVPNSWWSTIFLQHAENPFFIWVWNSLVGIVLAVLTFGCSIGNVSLAAVLWWKGISVSGVISFILASLLTFPMLSMYKKHYGLQTTKRLVVVNVLGIVVTGIVMEIFLALTAMPLDRVTSASTGGEIGHSVRLALNILFGVVGVLAFYVGRKHSSMGSMEGMDMDMSDMDMSDMDMGKDMGGMEMAEMDMKKEMSDMKNMKRASSDSAQS